MRSPTLEQDSVKTASLRDVPLALFQDDDLPADALCTDGPWFKDKQGRVCMLRGVNLSGACKLPFEPYSASHTTQGFFEHRQLSFVGRPFPLDEADEHLQRLKSWGFLFLRFQITWEAIEHAGPNKYDKDYFEYLVQVLHKAKSYGFKCFIDPHQDVWSRFTGGSGAPGWTLEMVGFDLKKFNATGAALVHNTYHDPAQFPRMIWPTNYTKLAAATMFTLFFGGKTFAPRCMVELRSQINEEEEDRMVIVSEETWRRQQIQERPTSDSGVPMQNIQDYLQDRYFKSLQAMTQRIAQEEDLLDSVVCGYDTLNEPSGGFLGHHDVNELSLHFDLKNGVTPTPLQAMLLGEGVSCVVDNWSFTGLGPRKAGTIQVNEGSERCWRDGFQCPWLAHGVYDKGKRRALKPAYFNLHPGTAMRVDWIKDFWKPFVREFTVRMREVHPNAIVFVEPPVNEAPPVWNPKVDGDPTHRICFAPHWYDGITLMNKHFQSWWTVDYIGYKRGRYANILQALSFGLNGVKRNFAGQLEQIQNEGLAFIGQTPCLMGEIGIPYDMDNKKAYKSGKGDYKQQLRAMDASMTALDRNLLNFTIWNYCPDNNHQWGDNWNGEDLSLWSRDNQSPEVQQRLRKLRRSFVAEETTSVIIAPQEDATPKPTKARQRGHQQTVNTSLSSLSKVTADSGVGDSIKSLRDLPFSSTTGQHIRAHTSPEAAMFASRKPMLPTQDLNEGARALAAFLRPYPMRTNGTPLILSFDYDTKEKKFRFVFRNDKEIPMSSEQATEIFLPQWHYGLPLDKMIDMERGGGEFVGVGSLVFNDKEDKPSFEVDVSDGTWKYDEENQVLRYFHDDVVGLGCRKVAGLPPNTSSIGLHEIVVTVVSAKERRRRYASNTLLNAASSQMSKVKTSSTTLAARVKQCTIL